MKKVKSLQKFTDLETLNDVSIYLNEKKHLERDSDESNRCLDIIEKTLNDSYANKLGEEYEAEKLLAKCYTLMNQEEKAEVVRNVTYETNHSQISIFIHNSICNNRRFPSITEIKNKTGLSRQTVYNHIKNGFKDDMNSLVKGKIDYMIPKALEKLYHIGIQDSNATALKNFIELSGYSANTNTTNVNNYIQINNLKLSKEEFEKLPITTIIEIENLVTNSLNSATN